MSERGDDYGDYSKFENGKNYVKEVNDLGEFDTGMDPFYKNYAKMVNEMQYKDGDRQKALEKEHVKDIMSTLDEPDFLKHVPNDDMMNEFI